MNKKIFINDMQTNRPWIIIFRKLFFREKKKKKLKPFKFKLHN